jgi:SAM-dependent methyltransferase
MKLKKIYRNIQKRLEIFFFKGISKIFEKLNYKIVPSSTEIVNPNLEYAKHNRRFIYKIPSKKFSKVIIDTTHYNSELCKIGANFGTNKSSLNLIGHRSGYTPFYDILFNNIRNKKINLAEIGIEKNAATKMWRKYFKKAWIYGLEYDEKKIYSAIKHKLYKTNYCKIDVSLKSSIKNSFKKINKKFDIIIDDSTHIFKDQINIIQEGRNFLKKGGILIIEDIYKFRKDHREEKYYDAIKHFQKKFDKIYFVEFYNLNNFTASWRCEKLLILINK